MKEFVKKTIVVVLTVSLMLGIVGYVGYRFYLYAIEDVSERIRISVSRGVEKGVSEAINPFKQAKKLFKKPKVEGE